MGMTWVLTHGHSIHTCCASGPGWQLHWHIGSDFKLPLSTANVNDLTEMVDTSVSGHATDILPLVLWITRILFMEILMMFFFEKMMYMYNVITWFSFSLSVYLKSLFEAMSFKLPRLAGLIWFVHCRDCACYSKVEASNKMSEQLYGPRVLYRMLI